MVLILFCLVVHSSLESFREELNQNITEKRHGLVKYCWHCVSCKKYNPGPDVELALLNNQEPDHSPFYEINILLSESLKAGGCSLQFSPRIAL